MSLSRVLALIATGVGMAAAAHAAEVTVLTGPPRGAVHDLFGPRLADALAPELTVELRGQSGSLENLEAIASDPTLVGFSQFDIFQRFVTERGLGQVLEYYGDVPVCILAVARNGSPITLELDDSRPAFALRTIDTGHKKGDAALTFELLQGQVPALQRLEVEDRGWSRALARLGQGRLDLVMFVDYPNSEVPLIQDVFSNPRVVFVQSVAKLLGPISPGERMPFLPTQISIPGEGWFDDGYTGQTYCTSLGIVVHADADPVVLDAVVRAVTSGALTSDAAMSWWQYLVSCLQSWAERGRGLVRSLFD
jgi:hypothetical protein